MSKWLFGDDAVNVFQDANHLENKKSLLIFSLTILMIDSPVMSMFEAGAVGALFIIHPPDMEYIILFKPLLSVELHKALAFPTHAHDKTYCSSTRSVHMHTQPTH